MFWYIIYVPFAYLVYQTSNIERVWCFCATQN